MMHCCICDAQITGTGWVCHACAKTYGLCGPVSTWPPWAGALRLLEKQARRQAAQDRAHGLVGGLDATWDETTGDDSDNHWH